jgi:hypothetical protein
MLNISQFNFTKIKLIVQKTIVIQITRMTGYYVRKQMD